MLEQYFVKPATIDRIRGSWMAGEIETYLAWLAAQGYSTKSIWRRIPITFAFGEFARERGATIIGDLPANVEAFVADRVARHDSRTGSMRPMAKEVRGPVEQMLSVVLPGFEPAGRPHHAQPFADVVPGFFGYLIEERGPARSCGSPASAIPAPASRARRTATRSAAQLRPSPHSGRPRRRDCSPARTELLAMRGAVPR